VTARARAGRWFKAQFSVHRLAVNVLLLVILLWFSGWHRTAAFGLATSGMLTFGLLGRPVTRWLRRLLEERFPTPNLPESVAGIVVLAGSTERIPVFVELARRNPNAALVFCGGAGPTLFGGPHLADEALPTMQELGLDPSGVHFERRSTNTFENASLCRRMMEPDPTAPWVLVTSALHMPRAIGSFRRVGWNPVAYPVKSNRHASGRLKELEDVLREWASLIAYRLLGRTSTLFPSPES